MRQRWSGSSGMVSPQSVQSVIVAAQVGQFEQNVGVAWLAGVAWHTGSMLTCRICSEELPDTSFSEWGKRRSECRDCTSDRNRAYGLANRERRNERLRQWRQKNPEAAKAKDLRARCQRKYGLTPEQVVELKDSQDNRCLICGVIGILFVDHDHATGAVRGALCPSCNTFLGRVESNPNILTRMGEYASGHLASPWLASSNSTSA